MSEVLTRSGPLSAITPPDLFEEPVASVLRALTLQVVADHGPGRGAEFRGTSLPQARQRVYGGQVLSQALLAAAATVPGGRAPHSLHASFIRSGVFSEDISFAVDEMRDGRSFSSRQVTARQSEGTICSAIASFQAEQDGLVHHATMPEAPDPEGLPSALDLFRAFNHPVSKFLGRTAAFDVRHCEDNLYLRPAATRSSQQMLWMRPRVPVPAGTPAVVHRALLTYVIDQVMLEPVLRAHGLCWFTPGLSLATLDHAQWFFADIDINDWLLYVQCSPAAQGARGLAECRVFTRAGEEVSLVAQEGMIRTPASDLGHEDAEAGVAAPANSSFGIDLNPVAS